ncbi:hypothetical protein [uncultured Flavobacterium sp.]|uniref:hypothetical protein n=1 Tax=uncultured Flavobacterium sp. TaxID=165435 RepID=UPI0025E72D1E|nr:hypothetical protein [uncultured Flavobacterium sp.]
MKKVKFAFYDWIVQLRKMHVVKEHEFNSIEQNSNKGDTAKNGGMMPLPDSDTMNDTGVPTLSTFTEETVAAPTESFFWPRPSAAIYERYRMQFSF